LLGSVVFAAVVIAMAVIAVRVRSAQIRNIRFLYTIWALWAHSDTLASSRNNLSDCDALWLANYRRQFDHARDGARISRPFGLLQATVLRCMALRERTHADQLLERDCQPVNVARPLGIAQVFQADVRDIDVRIRMLASAACVLPLISYLHHMTQVAHVDKVAQIDRARRYGSYSLRELVQDRLFHRRVHARYTISLKKFWRRVRLDASPKI